MCFSLFYRTEAVDLVMKKYIYNKSGIYASFTVIQCPEL